MRIPPPENARPARRRRAVAVMLACAALASGCAVTGPAGDTGSGGTARWSGRFAADWTEATEPPRSDRSSGRFELAATPAQTTLEVMSPFGQTVVRAQAGPDGASMETADGRRYVADTPEALTEAVLGWRIPILRLPHWLTENHPDRAVEDGWDVRVEERDGALPRRMRLRWPAQGAAENGRSVTIRLVVDTPSVR